MPLDKSQIKKVLLVSLTNIGDVILTLPVSDILFQQFPQAQLSILIGPKAETLLNNNPAFYKVHVFDKRGDVSHKWGLIKELRIEKYDLIVDLRNSLFPILAGGKKYTSFIDKKREGIHMKQKHLDRLATLLPFNEEAKVRKCVDVSEKDATLVSKLLENVIDFVVMAPGAAAHEKHWASKKYAILADMLIDQKGLSVVLVGDQGDESIANKVQEYSNSPLINLCGKTTLTQLAAILKQCKVAITNDSAPMHLASYLNVSIIAMFGPSNSLKYGPWSLNSYFFNAMKVVEPSQVFEQVVKLTIK